MPELYADPPHTVDLYKLTTDNSPSAGGGTKYTYVLVQAAVPCRINTVGSMVRSQFDQEQWVIPSRISFLSGALVVTPQRGWKAIATDTNATLVFSGGISRGRAGTNEATGIPAFTYMEAEEWI